MDVIEQIVDRLSIFNNLYDIIRIVDPISKNVINFRENTPCSFDETCFTYWQKEGYCKNCVSMRAYLEHDTSIKLEYKDDKVYIIIASPIIVEDKCYIVELLKDITAAGNIQKNDEPVHDMEKIIMEVNSRIITDEICGIYNRKYLNERLVVDMNESISSDEPISVIAMDLDLFSSINRQYGYKFGDKVLKETVLILLKHIGTGENWAARYGGDKFMLVLNKLDLENSYQLAEELRKAIEETDFSYEAGIVNITVSLSVCQITDISMDINQLLQYLKDGVHQAKSEGRNRTAVINL